MNVANVGRSKKCGQCGQCALPGVKPPKGETPRVKPPRFKPPRVKLPRVKLPRVKSPRIKSSNPPKFQLPFENCHLSRGYPFRDGYIVAHLRVIRYL